MAQAVYIFAIGLEMIKKVNHKWYFLNFFPFVSIYIQKMGKMGKNGTVAQKQQHCAKRVRISILPLHPQL
ncbi:MAG: hypothetical protein IK100_11600 [Muribaculaceae bacterium]|nr:hypothetical protein [Muribaculaceae bacterium]